MAYTIDDYTTMTSSAKMEGAEAKAHPFLYDDFHKVIDDQVEAIHNIVQQHVDLADKQPCRDAKDWCLRCYFELLHPTNGFFRTDVRCRAMAASTTDGSGSVGEDVFKW